MPAGMDDIDAEGGDLMYTFKLQVVLDHRQYIEDRLQKELADIRRQRDDARQRLEALQRKAADTAAALKREQANGLSSDRVVAYHAYIKRLDGDIARQAKAVGEIEARVRMKHNDLLKAVKNRQILEKLKEKEFRRYRQVIQRKEMQFIDEIAVNQFARKAIQKNGDKP
jgi:flagellar protein FliJ